MGEVDWAGIARMTHKMRTEQAPGLQALWDQSLAATEASARSNGVDLTDPAQARAALMGAAVMKNTVKASPWFPLFGKWFANPMMVVVATYASFLPEGES